MRNNGDVKIDDVREPRLSDFEKTTLASIPHVTFTSQNVLAEASRLTGLTDFGLDDFRPRLDQLMAEFEAERTLTSFGRLRAWQECVRNAANRLCMVDLFKRHPEIDQIVIDRPIFVAGLGRSGTSHLVNILAADRRLRSMPLWESLEPIPWPMEVAIGEDNRLARCDAGWGIVTRLQPYHSLMHDMGPEYVHEDAELMGANFGNYYPEWQAYLRGWQDYMFEDQTPNYEFGKRMLKAMTWLRGPNRWVNKSPSHMENLRVLGEVYPDATVAVLHRDPVAVIQSVMTMMGYADRLRRDPVDVDAVARFWVDRTERTLRACIEQRDSLGADRSFDVMFHEYMADPMGVVSALYERADLPLDNQASADIEDYIKAHPRGKHGRLIYDPIGDFGLDIAAVRKRFAFYYDRFPVQIERVLGEPAQ